MKKILIMAIATLGLCACNTMEGVGKDMTSAGHGISNSAQKVKDEIAK